MTAANTEHLYLTQKTKHKIVWKVFLNHSHRSGNFLIRNVWKISGNLNLIMIGMSAHWKNQKRKKR